MSLPLNIDLQQVLLHMLNFVILFGALYFLLYKPVKQFMDDRQESYAEKDRTADNLIAEAEKSRSEYEKKLAEFEVEAAQKRTAEQEKLAEESARMRERAQQEADSILAKARKAAEAERQKMLQDADREIADLAAAAAEKLVLKSTAEAYDQFLATAGERGHHA